jgi:hypothetical protein
MSDRLRKSWSILVVMNRSEENGSFYLRSVLLRLPLLRVSACEMALTRSHVMATVARLASHGEVVPPLAAAGCGSGFEAAPGEPRDNAGRGPHPIHRRH